MLSGIDKIKRMNLVVIIMKCCMVPVPMPIIIVFNFAPHFKKKIRYEKNCVFAALQRLRNFNVVGLINNLLRQEMSDQQKLMSSKSVTF